MHGQPLGACLSDRPAPDAGLGSMPPVMGGMGAGNGGGNGIDPTGGHSTTPVGQNGGGGTDGNVGNCGNGGNGGNWGNCGIWGGPGIVGGVTIGGMVNGGVEKINGGVVPDPDGCDGKVAPGGNVMYGKYCGVYVQ